MLFRSLMLSVGATQPCFPFLSLFPTILHPTPYPCRAPCAFPAAVATPAAQLGPTPTQSHLNLDPRSPGMITSMLLAAAAKSLQSCLMLCKPIDGSPPGSPVPGILQARTLEWVAISFSRDIPTQGLNPGLLHCRQMLLPYEWPAHAPLSMGFSRQEHWSALPCPPPGDLPNQAYSHNNPLR